MTLSLVCTIESVSSRDPERNLKHITQNTVSTTLSEFPKIPHIHILATRGYNSVGPWTLLCEPSGSNSVNPPVLTLGTFRL